MIELLEKNKTEISHLSIKIDGKWHTSDFSNILNFVKRISTILTNISYIKEDKILLTDIYNWSLVFNENETDRNLFCESFIEILKDVNKVAVTNSRNLESYVNSLQDYILDVDYINYLNQNVDDYFSEAYNDFTFSVIKIQYNSPGEIITGIPNAVAEQTSSILNTFLFYSKKKQQLELDLKLKRASIKDNERSERLQEVIEPFKELSEQLTYQIAIIKQFNELRQELINLGLPEEESHIFIREYISSYFEQLFPTLIKLEEINLLK